MGAERTEAKNIRISQLGLFYKVGKYSSLISKVSLILEDFIFQSTIKVYSNTLPSTSSLSSLVHSTSYLAL